MFIPVAAPRSPTASLSHPMPSAAGADTLPRGGNVLPKGYAELTTHDAYGPKDLRVQLGCPCLGPKKGLTKADKHLSQGHPTLVPAVDVPRRKSLPVAPVHGDSNGNINMTDDTT